MGCIAGGSAALAVFYPPENPAPGAPLVAKVLAAHGGKAAINQLRKVPLLTERLTRYETLTGTRTFRRIVLQDRKQQLLSFDMAGTPCTIGTSTDGKAWTKFGDWVGPATASEQLMAEDESFVVPRILFAMVDRPESFKIWRGDEFETVLKDGECEVHVDDRTKLVVACDYPGRFVLSRSPKQMLGLRLSEYVEQNINTRNLTTRIVSIQPQAAMSDAAFESPPFTPSPVSENSPVKVPFRIQGGRPVVEVILGTGAKAKTVQFLIDTGASLSLIDPKLCEGTATDPPKSSIGTADGTTSVSGTTVDSVKIGSINLSRVPMLIRSLEEIDPEIGGALGADILRRFRLTLDFDTQQATFSAPRQPGSDVPKDGIRLKGIAEGNVYVVDGTIDKQPSIPFVVDTGSDTNLLPRDSVSFTDNNVVGSGIAFGLQGIKQTVAELAFDALQVGPAKIQYPRFLYSDKSNVLPILGMPFLQNFRPTFDLSAGEIVLEPTHSVAPRGGRAP